VGGTNNLIRTYWGTTDAVDYYTPGSVRSTPVMTMLATGNVGIGTTNPGAKISVNGVIESTSGGVKFPDGSTQTSAAASAGGLTMSGNTTGNTHVSINVTVNSNTLLASNPTKSEFTVAASGNYLMTGFTHACGSFSGTNEVKLWVNGTEVGFTYMSTNCQGASFTIYRYLSAGDAVTGTCRNNLGGYNAYCSWTVVKF